MIQVTAVRTQPTTLCRELSGSLQTARLEENGRPGAYNTNTEEVEWVRPDAGWEDAPLCGKCFVRKAKNGSCMCE